MRWLRTPTRTAAVLATTAALVLVGCRGGGDEPTEPTGEAAPPAATDAPTEPDTTEDPGTEEPGTEAPTGGEVAIGRGVTDEPCPNGSPDRGCIYLGVISDLTVGPFAPLAVPITESQEAFWNHVNESGGIGGAYDVNISDFTRDSEYNPQVHAEKYEEIRGEVLAIAQSLGTSQTIAVLEGMDADSMVAAPMTWWSGWNHNDLIVQSGASYCTQGMNGVDYAADEISSIAIVKFPGDYGEDWAAGVRLGAEANDIEVVGEDITQVPIAAGGDVAATVGELASAQVDAVYLGVGPSELGEIVGGLVQQGYQGRFVGANPTYNGALLDSPVGPVLESSYVVMGAFEAYNGTSAAHDALRAAVPEPANDGATYGWMMSYPLLSALQGAHEAGDLTPEGVRTAAASVTVDYQGALPDLDLSGTPADQQVRIASISAPSTDGATGLATVEAQFAGDTAANHPYDEPCFNLS